jgi:hypothetical protein
MPSSGFFKVEEKAAESPAVLMMTPLRFARFVFNHAGSLL